MSKTPPLPPGFVLERQSAPPLPPGFVLEGAAGVAPPAAPAAPAAPAPSAAAPPAEPPPGGLSAEWGGFNEPPPAAPAPAPGGSVLDRAPAATFEEAQRAKSRQLALAERIKREREAAGPQPTGTARALTTAESLGMDLGQATRNPVARGAAAGIAGLGQVGTGAVRLAADLVGATSVEEFARGAAGGARAIEQAATAGLAGNDKLAADVTTSIINSAPSMAMGLAGGPALRALFAQSTLREYNAGRDAGFDTSESLARAGIMGFAEALGERFGFSEQLTILKAAARNLPRGDLAKAIGGLLVKEIPGEQLTTAMQFLADKIGPAALHPNATLEDYLNAAGETLKVTVGQMAVMGGGPAAISTTRRALQRADQVSAVPIGQALPQPVEPATPPVDPYTAAGAAGFHVDPPLTTDTPQVQRKKVEAVLDGVGAMYGIPPRVVQMLRAGAEGKPLADLGPAYARGIAWLQQRGLVPAEVAPEVMQALGHGAVTPPPEVPKDGANAPAAAPAAPAPEAAAVGSIEGTLRAAGALPDSPIDAAAHEAATSPLNDLAEPTDAQKEAGNYRKGHVRVSGFDVSIENPAGSMRRSKADAPEPWEVEMPAHYGYIRGTKGADGDHVDLFIGPRGDNGRFWVINQNVPDGKKFDEHKVVTGVDSADEAVALYKASFATGFGNRVFGSIGTELGSQRLRELLPSLERPKPAQPKPVRLQNRNRSDAGYVQQMQSIAGKPDPGRLGFSRDFASGAPVVLDAGSTPGAAYGRTDYVTTSKGRRLPVRYAVVEAASLLPSNTADGSLVAEYGEGAPGRARVVAGNGRAAGLVAGYGRGSAEGYRAGLAEDAALHGIDEQALAKFKQPVLVREMRADDVTPDIADESNVSGIAERSAPEVARDDARRIDLAALEFDEAGDISDATLRAFIDAQPVSEQTALRDARGNPTRQAHDRLVSAVFAAAYENDALLALQAQATEPEARTVLAGLVAAAPQMAQLRGMGDLDIRPIVAEAAVAAVNARRRGIKLADMAAQADLDAGPETSAIIEMFARNVRSAKRIGDSLRAAASVAREEATKPDEDMFGAVPKRTREQILQENIDDTAGPQDLEQPPGAKPPAGDARRRAAEAGTSGSRAGAQEERAAGEGTGQEDLSAAATADADTVRPERPRDLIELRKRLRVLESLRACLAGTTT